MWSCGLWLVWTADSLVLFVVDLLYGLSTNSQRTSFLELTYGYKAHCSWIKIMLNTWSSSRVSVSRSVCIMIQTQSGLEFFCMWSFIESAVFTSEGCWAKGFQSAVDDSLKLVCLGAFKMSGLGPFSKTHVSDLKEEKGGANKWVGKFASLCEHEHTGCGFIKKRQI